jgi:hypothetical protein
MSPMEMPVKDPLVEVLKTVTPEQARLVHEVLSGWCEDTRIHMDPDDDTEAKVLKKLPAAEALLEKLDAAMASFAGPITKTEPKTTKTKCELATEFCSGSCIVRYKGTKKDDPEFNACIACIAIMKQQGLKVKQMKS